MRSRPCGRMWPRAERTENAHRLLLPFPGNDVGPQRFDVVGLEHIFPRRHVSHAVGHGIDEACMVLPRKFSQILRPLRVGEARSVTGLAVSLVEPRAFPDLLRGERLAACVLRGGARAREREAEGEPAAASRLHSGISANVHTEPPAGTLSVTRRLATLPPRPESTVTYCRPLCV